MTGDFNNQQDNHQDQQPNYYEQNNNDIYHTDEDHDGIPTVRDSNESGYPGPNFNQQKKDDERPYESPGGFKPTNSVWDMMFSIYRFGMKYSEKYKSVAIGLITLGIVIAYPYVAIPLAAGAVVGFTAYKIHQRNKAKQDMAKGANNATSDNGVKTPNEDRDTGKDKTKEKSKENTPVIVKPLSQRRQAKEADNAKHASIVQTPIKTNTGKTHSPAIITPKHPQVTGRSGRRDSEIGSRG
jgi:hypothetical protein